MEFYSANEYWVKAGSLISTDPTGKVDLPDPDPDLASIGADRWLRVRGKERCRPPALAQFAEDR